MSMTLQNVWHLRRVADTAAKGCHICYKPSSSVLITPDNRDFFYVCPSHLTDRHFCSPIVDTEAAAAKAKEEAMAREIEKVKREYEEKQKRKNDAEKEKEKEKEKNKKDTDDQSNTKKADGEDKAIEKERDDKIEDIKKSDASSSSNDGPRVFALHKNFYQMRLDRMRNAEVAKRNRQRLQDPSLFPSVPTGGL
ncbi:hypothetical protein ASPCADRAFT_205066 [Aspergillus carbonarius ITEM 5010]|uniref:DUF1742-domain-containing protein n=1 Tax=Aspergillus carbonarius (strain ITEM 5010) TaxID=602072 RepID=A0A1R3RTH9_ASPC5|nr:hypothetical protein ASPCADRAFT_205066 [Aspergillus carbonarius ITEM 5010]